MHALEYTTILLWHAVCIGRRRRPKGLHAKLYRRRKCLAKASLGSRGACWNGPFHVGAQAAVLIATISGNDCSGVFGTGAQCVTGGTFDGTTLNATPLIAKLNPNGSVDQLGLFPTITGAEFVLNTSVDGVVTYTYTPGAGDPALQYVAVKAGDEFNLFSVATSGTDTLAIPGGRDLSHISFYDTRVPVPEPASILLFGAGLLGLGMARRARKRA